MAVVTVSNTYVAEGAQRTNSVSAASRVPIGWHLPVAVTVGVMAAAAVMWFAYGYWIKPLPITITTGYVPFAGLVVVTAALERLLEPLSSFLSPTDTQAAAAATSKSVAVAAGANPAVSETDVQDKVNAAAQDQAQLDEQKNERVLIFWAIASVCGLGVSGGFGLFLLQSVATSHVNSFLDLVVTGLAIGAGTKPLHDLITSIQSKASAS